MRKYNVLIFPCGTEIANEVINALKHHKYFRIKGASSEKKTYCNFRQIEVHFLPYVHDKEFDSKLKKLIKEENIDFIIPAHDDVAYKLSKIETDIHAKIIGQSKEVNEIVRFKDVTYNYFEGILPVPDFKVDPLREENYPIFVKPKRGQGSQNSFMLKSIKEYKLFKNNYNTEEFVIMEYLSGAEFTIDCFSNNGKLLYFGARTREKTVRGISVRSSLVTDKNLNQQFSKYANIISQTLNLHGIWFFQMKFDKNDQLKLLEIGPRISGTMMLNRARGVNFPELALYQKLGFDVEVVINNIENISLARSLKPVFKHDIAYENLYIDFDDTLFLDNKYINTDLMKLIFQAKNENKKVILITKNDKKNLIKTLHEFGILYIFDDIIHLTNNQKKADYMKKDSLLIDDSFRERKEAIERGIYAFGLDNVNMLLKE